MHTNRNLKMWSLATLYNSQVDQKAQSSCGLTLCLKHASEYDETDQPTPEMPKTTVGAHGGLAANAAPNKNPLVVA